MIVGPAQMRYGFLGLRALGYGGRSKQQGSFTDNLVPSRTKSVPVASLTSCKPLVSSPGAGSS